MNKRNFSFLLSALVIASSSLGGRADDSYARAVLSLNPVAYWVLGETNLPPAAYIATNSGTLGARGNAFYNNVYYPNSTNADYSLKTFFTGPVAGVTSDGDAAAQFNGGTNNNDESGYVLIPDVDHSLDTGIVPFTAEAWVKPEGGDPNDLSGASYASSKKAAAAIITMTAATTRETRTAGASPWPASMPWALLTAGTKLRPAPYNYRPRPAGWSISITAPTPNFRRWNSMCHWLHPTPNGFTSR